MKSYLKEMNLADARLRFSLRAKMTRTVMMNFKAVPEFKKKGWKCEACGELDTQEHIMVCPSYLHLRSDKVLSNDTDVVEYFGQIIHIRESMVN